MATAKRRPFHEMDHDHELLREEIVYASRSELRGPIPEFLAKKRAEQAARYRRGLRGRPRGLRAILSRTQHSHCRAARRRRCPRLHYRRTGTRHVGPHHPRSGPQAQDVDALDAQTRLDRAGPMGRRPDTGADLADFDLIDPELRRAAFQEFDARTFLGARNQAILALLSDCGVRRDELCILKDADVNLTDMQVRVYAPKTRQTRWRIVPFSDETAAVLANYVRLRERYLERPSRKRAHAGDDGQRSKAERRLDTDCFLISQSGGQLQGQSVASLLKRLCARLRQQGFEGAYLHAHLFRHDHITRKALDGENPSVLKRWVGHRTFAMTDRYFGIAESKLAAVRPKRSVLEGIVPLVQTRRGRPANSKRRVRRTSDQDAGPRVHRLDRQHAS